MLVINLKGIFVLTGLHEGIGEDRDGRQVVVDRQEFACQSAGIGETASLQVGLEQIAEAIGSGIEVGNFLERLDGGFGVASLSRLRACMSRA